MFLLKRFFLSCLFTISVISIISCSDSSTSDGDVAEDNGLLKFVPADTAYIFAALQPLPDEVYDAYEPHLKQIMDAYSKLIGIITKEGAEELRMEGRDDEAATFELVGQEVAALITLDGLNAAGMGRESTMVLYGDGLLPVLRVRLMDKTLTEQTLADIQEKARDHVSASKIGEQEYHYVVFDHIKVIFAIVGSDLVLTATPVEHSDALLQSVLGLETAESNFSESDRLDKLMSENGFGPHFLMWIDVVGIANTFLEDQSATNKEVLALMDYDATTISDICKAEIRELAGIAPQIFAGYSEFSTKQVISNSVIELRSDISEGLARLPAKVPGLGLIKDGLLSFGWGVDIPAAKEFYMTRLDALDAEPFECEYFSDFQTEIAKGRAVLNQPLPPVVDSIKGVLVTVDAFEGGDLKAKQPPTSVDGSLLLAMENPSALLNMGAMFSPELAALNLQPDGKPVKVDMPPIIPMLSETYVAMTDQAIAVSVGQSAGNKLTEMLTDKTADPAPILSYNVDADLYYGRLADAFYPSKIDDDGTSEEMMAAMREVMTATNNWIKRMSFDLNFTNRGIEMPSTVEFSESK